MDDLIKEFLVESNENLDRLDTELVKLEGTPDSRELLASIFRTIHSIKGACGFLGFQKLETLTHAGENLLSKLRDGKLVLTPEIGSALLSMVDAIREMLAAINVTEHDGEDARVGLIDQLKELLEQEPVSVATSRRAMARENCEESKPESKVATPAAAGRSKKTPHVGKLGGTLVEQRCVKPEDVARALEAQEGGDTRPIGAILVGLGVLKSDELAEALRLMEERRSKATSQDSTIRVQVTLLDRLMNLVGELVLARNQVLQYAAQQKDNAFLGTIQQLNLVTSELREGVMKTRMQPISRLFDKVPRVARDVSVGCGKQVHVDTEGKDTELDRTLLEAINDPLTHLVRNAIDHGIETPDSRVRAGKPPEGVVRLRASHEGGQVLIEISDDGAGIDVEKIKSKAVEKGAIGADQAARMSSTEALNLIFLPGVSTAEKVTNVSGRGVGMDVVKTNIEHVGGSVEIQTKLGEGSTFKIKVPLTLAIVPALVVRSVGRRFAIPQMNLVELVRLDAGQSGSGIELVHGAPVYRLRGRLLPLVYLDRELKLREEEPNGQNILNIVVLEVDGRRFGLVVDEVHDTEEIVVKPLGKHLKGIRVYAGATIMGDGQLALILDVPGLAESAGIKTESPDGQTIKASALNTKDTVEKQKLVLFDGANGSRMAIPLNALARLEKLAGSDVERSGNEWVVQYRGQILPLIHLSRVLEVRRDGGLAPNDTTFPPPGSIDVLVIQENGRLFGLIVNTIIDIVEDTTEVRIPATRAGVLYSAVIGERVTEMLDVSGILQAPEQGVVERSKAMAVVPV